MRYWVGQLCLYTFVFKGVCQWLELALTAAIDNDQVGLIFESSDDAGQATTSAQLSHIKITGCPDHVNHFSASFPIEEWLDFLLSYFEVFTDQISDRLLVLLAAINRG